MENLKNWMHFCVLKTSNWFFEFSWKEKMCLLSAANIEYKNFEEKYHIDYYIRFFGSLKEFLKKRWKTRKNGFCVRIWILSSKFSCQMLTADKRHVFSFHENWKNQFRGFKTKKCIQFISFPRLLRPVSDCSVKVNL